MNNVNIAAQDISEIKTIVQNLKSKIISPNDNEGREQTSSNISVNLPSESQQVLPPHSEEASAVSENNQFTTYHHRPYANAVRKNGLYSNPHKRSSASGATFTGPRGPSQNQPNNLHPGRNNNAGRPNGHVPEPRGRNIINGSRKGSVPSDSFGGDRILDIYVGGCKNETTADIINDYCRKYGVNIKKCELLPKKSDWVQSFKVSVNFEDREKLLKGDFWPTGIYVRKFFKGKSRNE